MCYKAFLDVVRTTSPLDYPRQPSMNSTPESELFAIPRISCRASLTSKKKCLQLLAELIESSLEEHQLDDSVDMEVIDALAARERLGCTGLGHGVAIPHGRVDFISEPIGAAITLDKPIDFDAADGEPVDIVVGLLIPESEVDGHLKILANLAKFFHSETNREAMRQSASNSDILEHLQHIGIDTGQPDDETD